MKNNGSIFITLGLLLIAAALSLTLFNFREADAAGDSATEIAAQLAAVIPQSSTPQPTAPQVPIPTDPVPSAPSILPPPVVSEPTQPQQTPLYEQYPEMEMPTVKLDGRNYLGVLKIPALGLELPVMTDWSYPKLKIAPCRYSGSIYQGDLVVMAHNYAQHFGRIKNLNPGDAVLFTDIDGNVFHYQVAAIETLHPTDVENMTAGEWPLTLFTCTTGRTHRVTVRCESVSS